MAITTLREGPPNPGALPLRTSPGWKKAARPAGLLALAIILILTFDKTVFLYRLTGAALRSRTGGPKFLAAAARCAYDRPDLLPLLEPEASDPEFVAAWLAEHLRRGKAGARESRAAAFLEGAAAKYPGNFMLDTLGAGGPGRGAGAGQDFDALFFLLAGDPAFNGLSLKALVGAFEEDRLPPETLAPLLSYLEWRGNTALAAGLAESVGASRAGSFRATGPVRPPQTGDARNGLAKLLGIDAARLALGPNLMPGPALADRARFAKAWEFLDMSGREPFAAGSFAGDLDAGAGEAVRIMGFHAETTPGRVPCRAGFGWRQALPLKPETYVLAFRYRTLGDTEKASFWLAGAEYLSERDIVPTRGEWRRVFFIFRNADLAIPEAKPLLRMWGTGTVWFAEVGLYAVEEGESLLPAAREDLLYE